MKNPFHLAVTCSISIFLAFPASLSFAALDKSTINDKMKTATVPFVANHGQLDSAVSHYANTLGGTLFVTHSGELVYNLPHAGPSPKKVKDERKEGTPPGYVAIRERLVNARIDSISAQRESTAKVSFFKGSDTSKWQSDIRTYEELSLGEVYKGIEVRLKARGDNVEKLFHISPGADPAKIQLTLSGIDRLEVSDGGELQASNQFGTVRFTRPLAWQEKDGNRVPVQVSYALIEDGKEPGYSFEVGSYDTSRSLIIDPLLASTYLGGNRLDHGNDIALDANGNVYITGTSGSMEYPGTIGVYDQNYNGGRDVFISKLSPDLSTLLASTLIGGTNDDHGHSIIFDNAGDLYIAGRSSSSDYPTTPGAFDRTYNGPHSDGWYGDLIITKVSPDLSQLLSSTYLGGSDEDIGNAVTLDNAGNLYVVGTSSGHGSTTHKDYPTTPGAYDRSGSGSEMIIVSRLSADLTTLHNSTYLSGGSGADIVLDDTGNVYLTGYGSSVFPTTADAYRGEGWGDYRAGIILAKFAPDLSSLLASTFVGKGGGNALAIDSAGKIYVAGGIGSIDTVNIPEFPDGYGTYDETYNGNMDILVAKFSENLDTLLTYTFIGGTNNERALGLTLDEADNVYITGYSNSSDYPIAGSGVNQSYSGPPPLIDQAPYILFEGDVIVSKMNPDLTRLLASTFIGGSNTEMGNAITLDDEDNIYVTGWAHEGFPTTEGSYDQVFNGEWNADVIVSKISFTPTPLLNDKLPGTYFLLLK